MKSVFDELSDKLGASSSLARRNGARQDLGLLLFNFRDDFRALWAAADRCATGAGAPGSPAAGEPESIADLRAAVERLRPLFGERENPGTQ